MNKGTVKWFNRKKGFGCSTNEDGGDVVVHYTGIKGEGFRQLEEGEKVTYDLFDGKNGPQAENVEVIGA